jgi:NADH-quinone oxidoreductase subunit F
MTTTTSRSAPVRTRRPAGPRLRHRRASCPPVRPSPFGSQRLLPVAPITSLDHYRSVGGLAGLRIALASHPSEIIASVLDAGLRGRGGAGFPTGRKWQTVAANALSTGPSTVVVNGAEGEPGTFKDRSILRCNPYQVIEGAFVAARAVHAERVIIALKRSFTAEVERTWAALDEMVAAGVLPTIPCSVFEGPDEYLYGEETALLETIDGRGPFPRIAPPYRVGLRGRDPWRPVGDGPALVNNVETIANVPQILAEGAQWFGSVGTADSAGTVVCTVTGHLQRDGVGEVPMGTPLRRVLDVLGGGEVPGAPVKAVLSGVANPVILGHQLDVPVSHEGLRGIAAGLGSAGFIVLAEPTDMVAVAAGVARFLSIESCGQCTPCKSDGATLYELLARLAASNATAADLDEIKHRVDTVAYGARCNLGVQQETVLASILERFHDEFEAHLSKAAPAVAPVFIAELADIDDGAATLDARHLAKQPDWTYGPRSSGATPADLRSRYRTT